MNKNIAYAIAAAEQSDFSEFSDCIYKELENKLNKNKFYKSTQEKIDKYQQVSALYRNISALMNGE